MTKLTSDYRPIMGFPPMKYIRTMHLIYTNSYFNGLDAMQTMAIDVNANLLDDEQLLLVAVKTTKKEKFVQLRIHTKGGER